MRNPARCSTSGNKPAARAKTEAYRLALTIEADFNAAHGDAATSAARQEAARAHLAQLRQKLRRERALGKGGHAGYDLSRHLALAQMVKQAVRTEPAAGIRPASLQARCAAPAAPLAAQQNAPAA